MALTLVTGAPGWLGTRLVRTLFSGLNDVPQLAAPDPTRRVRCLVHPDANSSVLRGVGDHSRLEIISGDLRDTVATSKFCQDAEGAILFHVAGVIHPQRGTGEFTKVNVQGTRNLLDCAERLGISRAVVVSSNSALGTNPNREHLFDELSPYDPYMGYGRSKMRMEQYVHEVQARGRMETVIVRPPWFYGPDQPPRLTLFFTMIKNGKVPIVGDGENRRSMAYIDNVCQGLLLCEQTPAAAGETYWIADARPYTMNEIVDTIERLLKDAFGMRVAKRRRLPNVVGELATFADGILQGFGFYQQKLHVLSEMNKTIACSIEKARHSLGYDPKIGLEEGMRRSIQWALDQGIEI